MQVTLSSSKETVPIAFFGPLAAVLSLGAYFALAVYGSVIAAYVLIVPVVAILFWRHPRASLCFLFASMFFQYFWIGVFLKPPGNYALLGTLTLSNAIIIYTTFFCSFIYIGKHWSSVPTDLRRILLMAVVFIGIVCGYAVLGWAKSSFGNMFVYLRSYSGAFLFLVIGAAYGLRLTIKDILTLSIGFGIIMVLYGFIEFLFPYKTYDFVHMAEWQRFKHAAVASRGGLSFPTIQSVIDHFTVSFLNLSGPFGLDFSILRPTGPVFHFINFAYALAFCSLAAIAAGRLWIGLFIALLIVIIGSKGAIALIFFPLLALLFNRMTGNPLLAFRLVLATLIFYVGLVFVYGSISNDNHFLGLSAGIRGFLSNPLGHGVGIGGNASVETLRARASGADFSSDGTMVAESAIFVLLYQMGALGFLSFFLYWKALIAKTRALSFNLEDDFLSKRSLILPVALSALFANAVFQEEAFSPHAWGLWLILTGVTFGAEKDLSKRSSPIKKEPVYENLLRSKKIQFREEK